MTRFDQTGVTLTKHHPIAPARHRMRNANSQPGIRRTADENTDADENGKEAGTRT